jgi:hypothetical protein
MLTVVVILCEMAEEDDRPMTMRSTSEFDSTMISGTAHLNEIQKENRAPPPVPPSTMPCHASNITLLSSSLQASPPIRCNTSTADASFHYHQL